MGCLSQERSNWKRWKRKGEGSSCCKKRNRPTITFHLRLKTRSSRKIISGLKKNLLSLMHHSSILIIQNTLLMTSE